MSIVRRIAVCFSLLALLGSWGFRPAVAADPTQLVAGIEQSTQQIRHLKALHSVRVKFDNDAAFVAALRANIASNTPEIEITLGQREDVLLGLLKPTDSLHNITYSGLTSQVIGFYDPNTKTLSVRNHLDEALGPERHVIAHEYTHALQDQYYHLNKLMPNLDKVAYRNSDALGARHALTEGDAVNTELLYIEHNYTAQEIKAFIKIESRPTPPLPVAMQRDINFPYTTGLDFVTTLYKMRGMASVDAAYHRLPSSTYEIMHPTAYLNGWKPVAVTLHGISGFPDWKQMDDDVFGAFGYQVLLWQFLPKATATQVTNLYRGDRYITLENGAQTAIIMKSVWTTHSAAVAARSAMLTSLRKRFPHAHTVSGKATTVTQANGAEYLRVSGTHLTLVYAPTADLAKQFGTAPASRGT